MVDADDPHPRHQRGLDGVRHRHDHLLETGVSRCQDAREDTADAPDPAIQAELADADQVTDALRLDHLGGREQSDRDGHVEGAAVLVQRRR